jgi:hypothetical protein
VDNGTQFDSEAFREFCDQIGTKIHFASVRHPESNGLVERANGIIMTGIMKLIFNQPRGKWPDDIIKVVWSHNTTVSRSTGFTPFKLLFGDEAITPEEAKAHYRRSLKFRGPVYFRRPAHENKEVIFVGLVADEYNTYFRRPINIFVGRPTKIRKLFSSATRPTKISYIFVGRGQTDENTSLTDHYFRRPH